MLRTSSIDNSEDGGTGVVVVVASVAEEESKQGVRKNNVA